jgi:hypothetical protein
VELHNQNDNKHFRNSLFDGPAHSRTAFSSARAQNVLEGDHQLSKAIENLQAAQKRAMAGRPKVGGFPYLAETLRRAGVTRNVWSLPSCQSLYLTSDGPVVTVGTPLTTGTSDVPGVQP